MFKTLIRRRKKENPDVIEIREEINNMTDLDYVIETTKEDFEEIINDNKLNLDFCKTIVTVNNVKFFYEIYKRFDGGRTTVTNVKKVKSYVEDFQRVNSKVIITTEEKMIVFSIPRLEREIVRYDDILEVVGELDDHKLPVIMGVDESNEIIVKDLANAPHAIVAGTTGSGKSVFVNTMICTWLLVNKPDDLQLAFIDPKGGVELSFYKDLKDYLFDDIKIKTDECIQLIEKVYAEMEIRYELIRENEVRDYDGLIKKGIDLPRIVLVIDEFANVMSYHTNKNDKEEFDKMMSSLLQMARASGIHCVIATQRPEVKVITGSVKANIPFRIGFALPSDIDSKTVIGTGGLEKLLGNGHGLMYQDGQLKMFQSSFMSDDEVKKVVEHVIEQCKIEKQQIEEENNSEEIEENIIQIEEKSDCEEIA